MGLHNIGNVGMKIIIMLTALVFVSGCKSEDRTNSGSEQVNGINVPANISGVPSSN